MASCRSTRARTALFAIQTLVVGSLFIDLAEDVNADGAKAFLQCLQDEAEARRAQRDPPHQPAPRDRGDCRRFDLLSLERWDSSG